jgi:L-2-hydroxyglutarate oxidase LhgO
MEDDGCACSSPEKAKLIRGNIYPVPDPRQSVPGELDLDIWYTAG